jgi:hypothetical protein
MSLGPPLVNFSALSELRIVLAAQRENRTIARQRPELGMLGDGSNEPGIAKANSANLRA